MLLLMYGIVGQLNVIVRSFGNELGGLIGFGEVFLRSVAARDLFNQYTRLQHNTTPARIIGLYVVCALRRVLEDKGEGEDGQKTSRKFPDNILHPFRTISSISLQRLQKLCADC